MNGYNNNKKTVSVYIWALDYCRQTLNIIIVFLQHSSTHSNCPPKDQVRHEGLHFPAGTLHLDNGVGLKRLAH